MSDAHAPPYIIPGFPPVDVNGNGWVYKRNGTLYPAKKDGTPDMRGGNGKHLPGYWVTLTPEERSARARHATSHLTADERSANARHATSHLTADERSANARHAAMSLAPEERSANARRAGQATADAGAGIHGRTPDQRRQDSRLGGHASAEAHRGGSWGCSGYIGDAWCASSCEKRVWCFYWMNFPGTIRRYSVNTDVPLYYRVPGEDVDRQWCPDLVVEDGEHSSVIEIKHAPSVNNLVITWQDVVREARHTANNIQHKSAAHPDVLIVNGAAQWLIEWYAAMRAAGQLPPFIPDVEGAPDR